MLWRWLGGRRAERMIVRRDGRWPAGSGFLCRYCQRQQNAATGHWYLSDCNQLRTPGCRPTEDSSVRQVTHRNRTADDGNSLAEKHIDLTGLGVMPLQGR